MKNKIEDSDKFKCKDYLSSLPISQARTLFKHTYSITENVKMNYKGDATFTNLLWKCQEWMNQDTEIHHPWCPAYEELRMGMDLSTDKDMCAYLQKGIQIRCKENKKWETDVNLLACKAALVFFLWSMGAEPNLVMFSVVRRWTVMLYFLPYCKP